LWTAGCLAYAHRTCGYWLHALPSSWLQPEQTRE
jgi:hypothetical protein